MKISILPPPISGAVQQSLISRSQPCYRLGRLLISFIILLLFAITPFGKVKGQYCPAASTIETCNTYQTLTGYKFGAWSYSWFKTDALGGNRVPIGIPDSNITVYPTQNIYDETQYYIEEGHRIVVPFLTCTSGVRTVKFIYELKIVSNNLNPPVYSISTASTIVYTNYQWYRNGVAIAGAVLNTYSPTTSGAYTLVATNSCNNTLTSNTLSYNAPNNQCSSNTPTYATCNASYTLSFVPASGYSVTWYACDASRNNGAILNNGNPTNSLNVFPSAPSTTQGYYYYYVCTDVFSNARCTSAVITVVFKKDLPITSSSSSLPATLTPNPFPNNNTVYGNYQWYRNGKIIPGANSSNFYAILPGDYYLKCSSNCGNSESNSISFGCPQSGATTYTNYTFPAGTYNLTGEIYIQGYFNIGTDANVMISNARIFLANCAEIIVDKNTSVNAQQTGGRLTISNSLLTSCGTWQGIKVIGAGNIPNTFNPKSATLTLSNVKIYDALEGVLVNNHGYLYGDYCFFENNITHLHTEGCGEMNGYMNNTTFSYLMVPPPSQICNMANPPTGLFPYVIHNYISMFTMRYDSFICYNVNGTNTEIALLINQIQSTTWVQTTGYGFYFTDSKILGDFVYAVKVTEAHYLHIDGTGLSEITGRLTQAIYSNGASNYVYINNQHIQNTSQNIGRGGIYVRGGVDVHITDNTLQNFERGIEYYYDAPPNSHTSYIQNNDISGCNYGIASASDEFPVGTSTVNTYTNQRDLKIYCNRILNCDYGIVGSGPMTDQGSSANGAGALEDWSNRFCSSFSNHACTGGSSNNYADIVWNNKNTGSDLNIYYDNGSNRPFKTIAGTLNIDGDPISSGNIATQYTLNTPAVNQAIDYYCPGNTYNSIPVETGIAIKVTDQSNISLYPNPATDKVILEQMGADNNRNLQIQVVDLMGRQVLKLESQATAIPINVSNLLQGIYTIKITELKSGHNYTHKISIVR